MVVVSVILGVVFCSYIDDNITTIKDGGISGPLDDGVLILGQHFKQGASQDFVAMEFAIVSADNLASIQFLLSSHDETIG